jgi:hypothetical protein
MRGEGQPQELVCPHCKGTSFEVFPGFSYQFDGDELSAEEQSHLQDFFDNFTLLVRCTACGALETPVNYECA